MNFNTLFNLEKYGWVTTLLVGSLSVILGLFAFIAPHNMMHTFIMLIGLFLAVSGLSTLIPKLKNNQPISIASALTVLIGVLIALAPEGTTTILVELLGFFTLIIGGGWLLASLLSRSRNSSPLSLVLPLVILITGIVIYTNRSAGTVFIMYALGFLFVVLGLALIALTVKTHQLFKAVTGTGSPSISSDSTSGNPFDTGFTQNGASQQNTHHSGSQRDFFSFGKNVFVYRQNMSSHGESQHARSGPKTGTAPSLHTYDDIIEVDNLAEKDSSASDK